MTLQSRIEKLEKASPVGSTGAPMPSAWEAPAQKWDHNCICFPCRPHFRSQEEFLASDAALCPLHGKRFTEHEPLDYCAAWYRRDTRPYDCVPDCILEQYRKAWLAGVPSGYLPLEVA